MNEIKFTVSYENDPHINVSIIGEFNIKILEMCIEELISLRDGLDIQISEERGETNVTD